MDVKQSRRVSVCEPVRWSIYWSLRLQPLWQKKDLCPGHTERVVEDWKTWSKRPHVERVHIWPLSYWIKCYNNNPNFFYCPGVFILRILQWPRLPVSYREGREGRREGWRKGRRKERKRGRRLEGSREEGKESNEYKLESNFTLLLYDKNETDTIQCSSFLSSKSVDRKAVSVLLNLPLQDHKRLTQKLSMVPSPGPNT